MPEASRIRRIGAGLSCGATLAWLLWPSPEFSIEPEPLVALLVALCNWLYWETLGDEGGDTKSTPSLRHRDFDDQENNISVRLLNFFDEEMRRFLSIHDLGASFDQCYYKRLEEFMEYLSRPENHYNDLACQQILARIKSRIDEILSLLLESADSPFNDRTIKISPQIFSGSREVYKILTGSDPSELDNHRFRSLYVKLLNEKCAILYEDCGLLAQEIRQIHPSIIK